MKTLDRGEDVRGEARLETALPQRPPEIPLGVRHGEPFASSPWRETVMVPQGENCGAAKMAGDVVLSDIRFDGREK